MIGQGDGGDLHVVWPDGHSERFHVSADHGKVLGRRIVERETAVWGKQGV
jgi:hypothetical protein